MSVALPHALALVSRGWMHGNVVVVNGEQPALIDTGYHTDVAPICAAFATLTGRPLPPHLATIALTHTHSDHAGGVRALVDASGAEVRAHPDVKRMVDDWDTRAMWLDTVGQQLPTYRVDSVVLPQALTTLGDIDWRVIHTPGHATGGVSYLWEQEGVLVSGDALWEDGFGILNPWSDGDHVFADAADALNRIDDASPRIVIPGHGRAFHNVPAALSRARSRLDYYARRPDRLQVQMVRSSLGFLRLSRPDLAESQMPAIALGMARWLKLGEDDAARVVSEIFNG